MLYIYDTASARWAQKGWHRRRRASPLVGAIRNLWLRLSDGGASGR